MTALAARILDLPEPELPLPPLRATARMSRPAAAAQAVVVMPDFIARPGETGGGALPADSTAGRDGCEGGRKKQLLRNLPRGGRSVLVDLTRLTKS